MLQLYYSYIYFHLLILFIINILNIIITLNKHIKDLQRISCRKVYI